jgi:sensor histidine kinase YesM
MDWNVNFIKGNKYFKLEIIFFVSLTFLIPIMSDLEYDIYEQPEHFNDGSYPTSIVRRIVWGSFRIIPYYLFYKLAIEGLLIPKKYLLFVLSFVFFVSFLDFHRMFMYKSISLMEFLPSELIRESKLVLNKPYVFHFNLNYMLKEMVLMGGLAYFINYREQQIKINSLKAMQLQSELNNLKLQLQPHFFFNTLNNIYSLALQNSENTAPMVARLSEMMRYVLYEAKNDKVLLKKEVDFLQNYIAVQMVRYDNRFKINFDTQGINDLALIEPLLLLPYIENTFKHGLEGEMGSGFIEIIVCLNENELTVSTFNKKPPVEKKINSNKGIGMENTQKRLKLLYPGKHTVKIEESSKQYKLTLSIILEGHG